MTCHMSWQKLCAEMSHSEQTDIFIDAWRIINLNLMVKMEGKKQIMESFKEQKLPNFLEIRFMGYMEIVFRHTFQKA